MHRSASLLAPGLLAGARALGAQDLAYLAEVPTAQRVAQDLGVASARETAAEGRGGTEETFREFKCLC